MRALLISTFCLSFLILPAQAGQLDNLESEATKSKSRSSKSSSSKNNTSSSSSGSDNSLESRVAAGIAEILVEATFKIVGYGMIAMVAGGDQSNKRYLSIQPEPLIIPYFESSDFQSSDLQSPETETEHQLESLFRSKGDPLLPTLRLSSHWLHSSNNINAQLHRLEAGYSFFGISHSQNSLNEDGDQLILANTLMHYRMSFGNNFSWDLAYGRGKMNGNQAHNGSVFAMPMRIRFKPDWHFEYYPVWSSYKGGSLAEHQFSINYHYKYVGATLGYKTWSAGTASIDGGFAGLYLSF